MSVITNDMVEAYARFHDISLEDGSQYPGVLGSLKAWEAGVGELNAHIVDAPSLRDIFKPLRDAYFAAKGVEVPEYSKVEDPAYMKQ